VHEVAAGWLLPKAWEVAGVALHLASDLPGTGSKPCRMRFVWSSAVDGFTAAARQIADKSGSHGLRPESKAGCAKSAGFRPESKA
jgi:hypothetical protein